MIKILRNAVMTLAASLLATTALKADDSQKQMRNLENRVSALEQRKSSGGIILPPVYPIVKNGINLSFDAELLVWKARQDDDTFAVSYPTTSTNGPSTTIHGDTPHYNWNSGFRFGLDYGMPHDGWNSTLDWTHIRNTSGAHPNAGNNFMLVYTPAFGAPPTQVAVTQSSKLKLDLLDLDLGRAFFTSKWLTLRPFAGLRASWIDQRYTTTSKSSDIVNVEQTRKNDTRGIGLRAGVDAEWGLGSGFSIFTDGAIGLIYTRFEPTVRSLGTRATATGPSGYILMDDYKKNYYKSVLNADLALGIQYEQLFSQDRYGIRFRAGWEQHLFVNQGMIPLTMQSINGASDLSIGDLSVQGWTLSAKLDF